MTLEKLLQDNRYNFIKKLMEERRLIYLTISGSHAYGVATPTSDLDIRGICLDAPEELLGLSSFEQIDNRETDTVIYGLKKFVKLCSNCNPNILEMLGTREEDIIYIDDIGRQLRDNIDLFVSKEVYYTFGGFAKSELGRIKKLTDDEKRRKAMYHYIRLMRIGSEILMTGKVNTYRKNDIAILRNIRNGKISYKAFSHLQEIHKEMLDMSFKKSKIKEKDIAGINDFLVQIYTELILEKNKEYFRL